MFLDSGGGGALIVVVGLALLVFCLIERKTRDLAPQTRLDQLYRLRQVPPGPPGSS